MRNSEMGSVPRSEKNIPIFRGDPSGKPWGEVTIEAARTSSNVIATKRGVGHFVEELQSVAELKGTKGLRRLDFDIEEKDMRDAKRLAKRFDKLKPGESTKGKGYKVTADENGFKAEIEDK
ncbi:MAG: hypothetical protein WCV83_00050 [Candidatus Magasanikbacteria bacterium]|jgi:hypothetical protein